MAETAAAPIMLSRHLFSECFASCTRAPRDTNRSTDLRSIDVTAKSQTGVRASRMWETNGRQVGDGR